MTVKEFQHWLIDNDHTQQSLAKRLGITSRTISNYMSNGHFPNIFVLALKGLENESIN